MLPSVYSKSRRIAASALTEENFRPFGTVIQSTSTRSADAAPANQGSALKIPAICPTINLYDHAPSKIPAQAMTSMFICSPRELREHSDASNSIFDVKILERHPYSTQTFVPLALDPGDDATTCYLVIVCPSLPGSATVSENPESHGNWLQEFRSHSRAAPAIDRAPDLHNTKAFIAHGNQAVTYAAGTWHAPMVVLGKRVVEFVVFQFANGVSEEDCQEVGILPENEQGEGVAILIDYFRTGKRAKI